MGTIAVRSTCAVIRSFFFCLERARGTSFVALCCPCACQPRNCPETRIHISKPRTGNPEQAKPRGSVHCHEPRKSFSACTLQASPALFLLHQRSTLCPVKPKTAKPRPQSIMIVATVAAIAFAFDLESKPRICGFPNTAQPFKPSLLLRRRQPKVLKDFLKVGRRVWGSTRDPEATAVVQGFYKGSIRVLQGVWFSRNGGGGLYALLCRAIVLRCLSVLKLPYVGLRWGRDDQG